jgi:D-sedoheptulose 7-phosphate isomerase
MNRSRNSSDKRTLEPVDDFWPQYQGTLTNALLGLQVSSRDGRCLVAAEALADLCAWADTVRAADGTIIFAGNGGSAAFASHMAADWTKHAGVRALACTDTAMVTATANDRGFDRVFSDPVTWYGRPGDLLVTISSSGNSPNVVRAIEAGHAAGMRVITFSGMKPDNESRRSGDLNFYVPGWSYGIVECSHQILLHAWLDRYLTLPS